MSSIAVFPGSFDPFTLGHESIVTRAIPLFDKIIIAIGHNSEKRSYFTLEQRINWIKKVFENEPKVEVKSYEGLTIEFCRQQGAGFILRGLRTAADFEYERAIAQVNLAMNDQIESVFLLTLPEHSAISSSLVREILRYGGNGSKFVPKAIQFSIAN